MLQRRAVHSLASSRALGAHWSRLGWRRPLAAGVREFCLGSSFGNGEEASERAVDSEQPHEAMGQQEEVPGQGNARKFKRVMEKVAEMTGARTGEDWREVTRGQVLKVPGGSDLLASGPAMIVEATKSTAQGEVRFWDCSNMFPASFWRAGSNRRAFVRYLAKELGIEEVADWREVPRSTFVEFGGKALLRYVSKALSEEGRAAAAASERDELRIHGSSKESGGGREEGEEGEEGGRSGEEAARYSPGPEFLLLKETYGGEVVVEPECRGRVHASYWKDVKNVRAFLDRVADVHGVETAEDWSRVGVLDIKAMGGAGLLSAYGNVVAALQATYPETLFDVFTCRAKATQGYWTKWENRRAFMEEVARRMEVARPRDWRRVQGKDIRRLGGGGLLERFKGSVFGVLADAYPEQRLPVSVVRDQVPRGHWAKRENRLSFLSYVARSEGVAEEKDWQAVTPARIKDLGGAGLLYRYKDSVHAMLCDTLGELSPEVYRQRIPATHWGSDETVVAFLDNFSEERGISTASDWAAVTSNDIRLAGGYGILSKYGSLYNALNDVYKHRLGPEESSMLEPLLRPRVQSKFWHHEPNVISFVWHLEKALHIQQPEDWFRVSTAELFEQKAGGLIRAMPLVRALELAYPDVKWHELQTNMPKKSSQRLLRQVVLNIFGCERGLHREVASQ